jgi:hypothetical protein
MKNQELFEKTVAILATAYKENKLVHASCAACAVGNLVANNCGYDVGEYGDWHRDNKYVGSWWYNIVSHAAGRVSRLMYMPTPMQMEAQEQVASTGYTALQLAEIEAAFEGRGSLTGESNDELELYDRLVAVYEKLCEIHEVEEVHMVEPELVFVK